jgi:hypothetical protein
VSDFSLKYAMKKRAKKMCDGGAMAEGGEVDSFEKQGNAFKSDTQSNDLQRTKPQSISMPPRQQTPEGRPEYTVASLAAGGEVSDEDKDADMIARIMHKRKMYSEGGMVANDDEPIADSMPAQFDDLALDDHLEMHETGANSGDELGDAQEDEDRHDIVAKIMKSRAKKDRNPRPA